MLEQLVDHLGGRVDRDRKRDAHTTVHFHGVDTDDIPIQIHQRATRVARVDGCIRLNVFAALLRVPKLTAVARDGTDNASTDAVLKRERASKCTDPLASTQLRRRAESDRGPFSLLLRLDLQDGNVRQRIRAVDRGWILAPVRKRDL